VLSSFLASRGTLLAELLSRIQYALYVTFLFGLCLVCQRRPIADDFDRYVYEAIVRGRTQSIDEVYNVVKHENPRAEASAVLDSPQHLQELEPLYAIRPLYVELVALLSAFFSIQNAINFVSAASLFGIGIIVLCWSRKPFLSALLMTAYPVLLLGRAGTPDALAGFLAILGLWLIQDRKSPFVALIVLFISLGVRTDNLLLLLGVLAWLVWGKRVASYYAGLSAILAIIVVLGINRWAGNYGWIVLFRYSFVAGRYPAQIPHTLTLGEYLSPFASGVAVIATRVSLWLLLGILAYRRQANAVLLVCAAAVAAHFLMFPSPDDRYLVWAYVVVGIFVIRSFARSGYDKNGFGKLGEQPLAIHKGS
jgi:hypothetical protein